MLFSRFLTLVARKDPSVEEALGHSSTDPELPIELRTVIQLGWVLLMKRARHILYIRDNATSYKLNALKSR